MKILANLLSSWSAFRVTTASHLRDSPTSWGCWTGMPGIAMTAVQVPSPCLHPVGCSDSRDSSLGQRDCHMQSCPGKDNRLSVNVWNLRMAPTTELPLEEKLNLSHTPIPVLWLHLQRSWPAFCHHGNLSGCQGVVCVCGWYLKAKSGNCSPPLACVLVLHLRDKRKGKRLRKGATCL
jgi:hypothetical protein